MLRFKVGAAKKEFCRFRVFNADRAAYEGHQK